MFDFLTEKFSSIFSSFTRQNHLTQQNMQSILEQVKDALIEADVSYDTVQAFANEVQQEVVGKKIISGLRPSDQFIKIVYDKMVAFLGGAATQETFTFQIPSVICVMGLQGSGKTTTIGKLAYFIKNQAEKRGKSRKILCASIDFYRPAAIDQLEQVARGVGVDFYRSSSMQPQDAARDIISYFKKQGYEHLLFDTAGRLHVDEQMMQELASVKAIIEPKYSFLVLDSMTGQQSLAVATDFLNRIGFDGAILSKMDSDTRAGAAFAFRYELKKPICFMGVGEKFDQLELFRPERIAKRMLGMGDILTLVENAQEKIKQSEQESIARSIASGNITLNDFSKQLDMMAKLGSIGTILKFLPGAGQLKLSDQDLYRGEQEMKRFKAVLSSMTLRERQMPDLLDASRKKRIALGAGVDVTVVNLLLQRFEQSKQFVKLLKKNRFFK
ncbi:signal recognition particle protein [Candidatus Dependentiae bacterium]|nr:signal recognition particle protein [Candidatus Dependentiae bacterium]